MDAVAAAVAFWAALFAISRIKDLIEKRKAMQPIIKEPVITWTDSGREVIILRFENMRLKQQIAQMHNEANSDFHDIQFHTDN